MVFCVCYLDQNSDPLRCLPHPRKHIMKLAGFVLLPTLLLRILIMLAQWRKDYLQMWSLIILINVCFNLGFALWTSCQLWEILNHPRLADCKYSNHSMLEINYIGLLFLGLFLILILTCFTLYCIGLLSYTCYKSCRNQRVESKRNNVTRAFLRLLIRT